MTPRTASRMRRKGEPQAPRPIPDEELATTRPDLIEKRLREHTEWAARLEKAPDPGAGLPPAKAQQARHAQLAETGATHRGRGASPGGACAN